MGSLSWRDWCGTMFCCRTNNWSGWWSSLYVYSCLWCFWQSRQSAMACLAKSPRFLCQSFNLIATVGRFSILSKRCFFLWQLSSGDDGVCQRTKWSYQNHYGWSWRKIYCSRWCEKTPSILILFQISEIIFDLKFFNALVINPIENAPLRHTSYSDGVESSLYQIHLDHM